MSANSYLIDFPVFQVPEFQFRRERCRGENQKKVLILLPSDEDTEVLQTFLTKILAAVHLDLQKDILLYTVPSTEKLHLQSIIRQEEIQTVLIFGLAPTRLGVHLTAVFYEPLKIGMLYLLFAHSLMEIHEERRQGGKQKAGALWRALQSLFLE